MLKWLAGNGGARNDGSGPSHQFKITDDPLATINFQEKKRTEIYAVNRQNPLFLNDEDVDLEALNSFYLHNDKDQHQQQHQDSSSGYDSNPTTLGLRDKESPRPSSSQGNNGSRGHVSRTTLNSQVPDRTVMTTGSVTSREGSDDGDAESARSHAAATTTVDVIPGPVWPAGLAAKTHHKVTVHHRPETPPSNESHADRSELSGEVTMITVVDNSSAVKNGKQLVGSSAMLGKGRRVVVTSDPSMVKQVVVNRDLGHNNGARVRPGVAKSSNIIQIQDPAPVGSHISAKRGVRVYGNSRFVKQILVSDSAGKPGTRSWPGASWRYNGGRSRRVPTLVFTPNGNNRCFNLRHLHMSPIGEEGGDLQIHNDSLVTQSLLDLTSLSAQASQRSSQLFTADREDEIVMENGPSDETREDMERVIHELTQAIVKSRGVNSVTRAVNKRREAGSRRGALGQTRRYSSESSRSGTTITSTRSSVSAANSSRRERRKGKRRKKRSNGVDTVKDLWARTGMKTNGRKLLIDKSGEDNQGYQTDESSTGSQRGYLGRSESSASASTFSFSNDRRVVSSGHSSDSRRSRVVRGDEFDSVRFVNELHGDGDNKQVRFNKASGSHGDRGLAAGGDGRPPASRQAHHIWETYYGTAFLPPGVDSGGGGSRRPDSSGHAAGLPQIYSHRPNLAGTALVAAKPMVPAGHGIADPFAVEQHLAHEKAEKRKARRKRVRRVIGTVCFLLMSGTFIVVIVAVVLFISKGSDHQPSVTQEES